jgi:hypothetical protein
MLAAYPLGGRFDLVVEGRWWLESATAGLGAAWGGDASNVVLPVGWTVIVASGTGVTCLTAARPRHANQVTRLP